MKRTTPTLSKPDLILTSDWHLREDQPVCRTDDFWSTQWQKVDFVRELQDKYSCPVIHAGDLFHHWKPSPYLLSTTMEHLPDCFYTIYGQHDLPQHNFDLLKKSGINVLDTAPLTLHSFKFVKRITGLWNMYGVSWGQDIPKPNGETNILVAHRMTYDKELPYPGCTESPAVELLKKYPMYDLIITGDNHQTFTVKHDGRLLVNPGSLTRQTAAQINHRPCVFLWFSRTNTVEPVYLPIEKDAVSREHLIASENRNQRLTTFISRLNTEWEAELNIEENLKRFFSANKTTNRVREIILNSIGK